MQYLENKLREYSRTDAYPFHMPGHKRRGGPLTETDLTEIDGFDNLHHAEEILLDEMNAAAAFYHTEHTRFLINGSTCGLLSAISAAVPRGGRLLTDRGAHISVYHAAYLRDLELSYLPGGQVKPSPSAEFSGGLCPDAVLITSPSYEGCVRDVRAWAEWAHSLGAVLIVDEAHGAHFSMHPYFPESAVREGADLVIQSVHKTLPALTQTSLLHNVSGKISQELLDRFLRIYETSSPSYLLMSSITSSIHACMDGGPAYFRHYTEQLRRIRRELSCLRHLKLAGVAEAVLDESDSAVGYPAGTIQDPGKLVILTGTSGLTGSGLYDLLRLKYRLQPEMKSTDYVLMMTSVADTDEGFSRLLTALKEIDAATEIDTPLSETELPSPQTASFPPAAMRIARAWDLPFRDVPLSEAEGLTCAEFVIVYPPDSPLIVPGEICTEEVLHSIRGALDARLTLTGLTELPGEEPKIRCCLMP